MSGSGVYFSAAQLATMQTAITMAQSALAENNPGGVLTALNTYYSTQIYQPGTSIVMRGYAELA